MTTNVEDFVRVLEVATDIGNRPPQTGIYPDLLAPIVRNRDGFRELTKVQMRDAVIFPRTL